MHKMMDYVQGYLSSDQRHDWFLLVLYYAQSIMLHFVFLVRKLFICRVNLSISVTMNVITKSYEIVKTFLMHPSYIDGDALFVAYLVSIM